MGAALAESANDANAKRRFASRGGFGGLHVGDVGADGWIQLSSIDQHGAEPAA